MNPYGDKFYSMLRTKYRKMQNDIGASILAMFPGTKSLLDLGCGVGGYLEGALSAGICHLVGVEYNYTAAEPFISEAIRPYIVQGDVTKPLDYGKFDLVMSIEVAEHINPDGTDEYVANMITAAKGPIILSAAPPGQTGNNHINCQPKAFWDEKFLEHAYYPHRMAHDIAERWGSLGAPSFVQRNLTVYVPEV